MMLVKFYWRSINDFVFKWNYESQKKKNGLIARCDGQMRAITFLQYVSIFVTIWKNLLFIYRSKNGFS